MAENYHRTLVERVRCLLSTANLPYGFWGEALQMAVYLCNRSPHMSLQGDIPIEVWYGKPTMYDHLRIFGCDVYVHVRPEFVM